MIKQFYIYHRNGTLRTITYHAPDPSDPPEVQTFFARSPPYQHEAVQIDLVNEFQSYVPMDATQIAAMFVTIDAARAAVPA